MTACNTTKNLGDVIMVKTMEKYDFIIWEETHDYDLPYSAMSRIIKFDDISADNNIYDTVGRVMEEIAGDDDIGNIRAYWHNGECILITGYPDSYHSFVIDGCIYIH